MITPVNKTNFIAFIILGIYIYLTYFNIFYCAGSKIVVIIFVSVVADVVRYKDQK